MVQTINFNTYTLPVYNDYLNNKYGTKPRKIVENNLTLKINFDFLKYAL